MQLIPMVERPQPSRSKLHYEQNQQPVYEGKVSNRWSSPRANTYFLSRDAQVLITQVDNIDRGRLANVRCNKRYSHNLSSSPTQRVADRNEGVGMFIEGTPCECSRCIVEDRRRVGAI